MDTPIQPIDIQTDELWCQLPYHSIMLNPEFEVRPCCRYQAPKGTKYVAQSVAEALTPYRTGYFQTLRDELERGKWPAGCKNCQKEEAMGAKSMRENSTQSNPSDNTKDLTLSQLEISVGRICNLKCRSCGSHSSTKWDSDEKSLGLTPPQTPSELDLENLPMDMFKNLRMLKITGGEPLLHKRFFKLLERICAEGFQSEISLELFTNGTLTPTPDWLEVLSRFKRLDVNVSIDAYGSRNSYLRHPSVWSDIEASTEIWRQWAKSFPGKYLNIASTLSVFNIMYFDELLNWANSYMPESRFHFQLVQSPLAMNASLFPAQIKSRLFEYLEPKLPKTTEAARFSKRIHPILMAQNVHPDIISLFENETRQLDVLRNESYPQTFPELYHVIEEYKRNN